MAGDKIDTEIDLGEEDIKSKKIAGDGSTPEGDELDIEVEDDTPPEDRGRPPRKPGTKSSIPDDDEIGQYTKGVQDRLKQMKWEYHEERRAKEAWERQSTAAVEYAKKVHAENQRLRKLVTEGGKTLREQTKVSGENEIAALKKSLKAALDTGDTDAAADLNAKIAAAAARVEAQNHIAPVEFAEEEEPEEGNTRQRQPQRQEVRVSQTMQNWMDENPWFNENKRMTAFAFGVHEELIQKGIPVESPRYFKEINKAMESTFPQYFANDEDEEDNGDKTGRRPASGGTPNGAARRRTPVAGVQRNTAGRSNKVTLTSSELAVAKRMGITPEAYAREKQRLETLDNG